MVMVCHQLVFVVLAIEMGLNRFRFNLIGNLRQVFCFCNGRMDCPPKSLPACEEPTARNFAVACVLAKTSPFRSDIHHIAEPL
jgi:hypothetical protein